MARRTIKSFKFQSEIASNGRPRYFLPGVPKRNLDADDIRRLSDEDYEAVKSAKMPNGDKLYVRSDNSGDSDDESSDDSAQDDESDAASADDEAPDEFNHGRSESDDIEGDDDMQLVAEA